MTWHTPISRLLRISERTSESANDQRNSSLAVRTAVGSLLAIGVLIAVLTARDYGVAWDDSVQTRYGNMVFNYFQTWGADRSCNELLDLRLYGPPVELAGAALARWMPDRKIEMRHLLTALIALLSIPALARFGRLLGSPWLGVVAAVLLWLMPRFYGHAFVNTKDIPFAVGMIASIGALSALFSHRQYRWREMVECGLLLGCTVSVRPGGWLLLGPIYVAGAVFADWQSRRTGAGARRALAKQGVMFAVAWTVMILCWPWAHESPAGNPLQAIRMSSKFHIVVPVLFDGQMMMSDALPRLYLLKYIVITTPVAILGLAGAGVIAAILRLFRQFDDPIAAVYWMLLVWLGLPLVIFAAMRPNAYDGLRHFLFVLPAIACFAAIGVQAVTARLPQGRARWLWAATVVLSMAFPIIDIARLHPYQVAYFNQLVGGAEGATGRYDTEYWMTSYREAMEWIRCRTGERHGRSIRVLVAANENSRWCAEHYADDRIEIVTTLTGGQPGTVPADVDYYLGTTRSLMSNNFPDAQIVKQVGRDGAVFAVVKQ